MQDAVGVLSRVTGCSRAEAYLFVTTVGDLRNGAVCGMGQEPHPPLVVGVEVPLNER